MNGNIQIEMNIKLSRSVCILRSNKIYIELHVISNDFCIILNAQLKRKKTSICSREDIDARLAD